MPNLNEFIGPKPDLKIVENLEKIIGIKPCFKCDLDVQEYFWDPIKFIMTWECANGHHNSVVLNQ